MVDECQSVGQSQSPLLQRGAFRLQLSSQGHNGLPMLVWKNGEVETMPGVPSLSIRPRARDTFRFSPTLRGWFLALLDDFTAFE